MSIKCTKSSRRFVWMFVSVLDALVKTLPSLSFCSIYSFIFVFSKWQSSLTFIVQNSSKCVSLFLANSPSMFPTIFRIYLSNTYDCSLVNKWAASDESCVVYSFRKLMRIYDELDINGYLFHRNLPCWPWWCCRIVYRYTKRWLTHFYRLRYVAVGHVQINPSTIFYPSNNNKYSAFLAICGI